MSEKQKAPAYQWYPKDYDSDEAVRLMTYEQEGIYRRLLDHQSLHGSIPADPSQIALLVPKVPKARFLKLWPALVDKFPNDETGRRVNPRMVRAQAEFDEYVKGKQDAGRRSAEARRLKYGSAQPSNSVRESVREPVRDPFRTGPEPATATATATATAFKEGRRASDSGSKRPIFSGQRLTVFEWMLDECIKTLGTLTESFDLHEWFFTLDAELVKAGEVAPKRDGGAWLQARLLAEAERRGLPLRVASLAPRKKTAADYEAETRREAEAVLALLHKPRTA